MSRTRQQQFESAKIYFDSPGADTGSNSSLNAEWIRLKNTGSTARNLTGWTVRDTSGHVYKFGTYRLGAGKTVTIHTGNRSNTARNRYWRADGYIWNNDGDTATLKNNAGSRIAAAIIRAREVRWPDVSFIGKMLRTAWKMNRGRSNKGAAKADVRKSLRHS